MNNLQQSSYLTPQQAAAMLLRRRLARAHLLPFIQHCKPDYIANWHHRYLCGKLEEFATGSIKRMMVFMPPQHGKSEIVSRNFPAWMFGQKPHLRIVSAAYNHTFASKFNRAVQRIIDDKPYAQLFPEVFLNDSNVRTVASGSFLRNSDEFEIVGKGGSYISVGVGGGLTGNPADLAIIDDPIKDSVEAYSAKQRETLWEWYTDVLETRLHNDSQVLLTMTRWHEDDLAGRLLDREGHKWTVVNFPAIKEDNYNPDDPRPLGEPLWPERHSLESINDKRSKSERTFSSLYQQRPAPLEGDILKKGWFDIVDMPQLDRSPIISFTVDTAYTDDERNDETAILPYFIHQNALYLVDMLELWEEFPDLVKTIPAYAHTKGYTPASRIYVEPKASGKSVVQQLKKLTTLNLIEDTPPKEDKVTRASVASATMEARRVKLIKGSWNRLFLDRIGAFPNAKNKGIVDCLVMAVNKLEQPSATAKPRTFSTAKSQRQDATDYD